MVKFYVNCKHEPIWKWSLVTENATDTNRCYENIFNDIIPGAHNRFNQMVEAKRFECVFLCRKVC